MIAREGFLLIALAAGIALVLAIIGSMWVSPLRWLLYLVALLLFGFVVWFFRDPKRMAPDGASTLILAPADGKVVQIIDLEHEDKYLGGPARLLSIFLSPLNVHVNRVPVDGLVEYVKYVPGDYLVAWHPKASELNEHSEIGVRHPSGLKVLFKQIAGIAARRIVFYLNEGDVVRAGERFGIVKFGSRMDVIVPPDVTFDAKVGDRVVAGVTILARLPVATTAGQAAAIQTEAA